MARETCQEWLKGALTLKGVAEIVITFSMDCDILGKSNPKHIFGGTSTKQQCIKNPKKVLYQNFKPCPLVIRHDHFARAKMCPFCHTV